MSRQSSRSIFYLSLASLIVLSGCLDKFKKKENESAVNNDDQSLVLLTVNGVPKITVNNLEADLNELSEMDQQIKMMLMFDPEGTKERVFKEQKRMAIIEEWARVSGVRDSAEYQSKKARIMNHVGRQLDFEQFLNTHKVDVTQADVLDYYNQHKDQDYHILISPAGIKTQTVEFATQNDAQEFVNKLKQAGINQIDKLANEQKLFVRNLNINETSYADKDIKEAVLKMKNFPAVVIVPDQEKGKFWVVAAQEHQAAKYQEFDKVKDALKQMLMPKKVGEMLEVKIPEYGEQFNLVENTTYFEDLKNAKKNSVSNASMIDMQDQNENGEEFDMAALDQQ